MSLSPPDSGMLPAPGMRGEPTAGLLASGAAVGRRHASLPTRVLRAWPLYLALAPTLILIAVFAYWPTVNGFIQSVFNSTNTQTNVFVGLDNYSQLLSDSVFWGSFVNAIKYFVFGITIGWLLPFVTAELLISLSNVRLQYILRTALILPMAFPAAVFGFVWSFLYDPNVGVINTFLNGVGLSGLSHKATTPLSTNFPAQYGVTPGGTSYMIPATTTGDKLTYAIRFMQFVTAPRYNAPWASATTATPSVQGVAAPASISAFSSGNWGVPQVANPGLLTSLSPQNNTEFQQIMQGYLLGSTGLAQTQSLLEASWQRAASYQVGLNPQWRSEPWAK